MSPVQEPTLVNTRMIGVRTQLTVVVNQGELHRRAATRGGAITSLDVLDCLLGLPLGLPVSVADLTDRERRVVDRLSDSVVVHRGYDVIRRAEPVVDVTHAAAKAQDWRCGLVRASLFAPWCSRSMVLPSRPPDEAEAAMQASYYGIGIVVETGTDRVTLVDPKPWVNHRVTPARWWFTEAVYEQMTSTKPNPVTPAAGH